MNFFTYQKFLIFWQKLTSGSTNRKIFGAAVIVGMGVGLSKLASVVKELVVAWKFGTGDELDAFLIAFVVPSFINNVVAGSFNAALIPTYIQVQEKEGKKASQKLFSGAIVWSTGLLAITMLFMLTAAPLYLPRIATGFNAEKLDLTYKFLWALSPFLLLSGIHTTWIAVLNAGERFALASISQTITPTFTIILLLIGNSLGVFMLVIGLVGGGLLETVIIGIALHRQGVSLVPKWYGFDSNLSQVANQYTPMIAGAFLMCSSSLVDQSMAAMLSPGSVAALNYGNRVIALPITLTTTALSTAVIPYFSKMVAHQDWQSVRHTLKRYLGFIFVFTVPMMMLFIIFSEMIVQLLFQRGSFTANDTHIVAQIQTYFAFQIPFYVANILVVRLISSMKLNQILMWVSGFNLIINIVLNYLFMQWMGIKGIALSTSCVYVFCFLYLLIFVQKKLIKYSCSENIE